MHRIVQLYGWAVIAGFSLLPMGLLVYVAHWQPDTLLVRHGLHEIAIGAAVVVGGFVSYVTWRCYRYSGEVFLRWLTLGLAGFTLLYFVHGVLTEAADTHIQVFLNFGIVARLVLMVCLMVGALRYRAPADPPERREARGLWLAGFGALAVLGVAVALFSQSALAEQAWPRIVAELFTIACGCIALTVQLLRGDASPLMSFYVIALALLAQSSVAFLMSAPWNHIWWLAHLIGVAGFLALSYGVAIAFRTTGSFAMVYSQEHLMNELRRANAELEARASTDSLTGARTRGEFMRRAAEEIERARRHDHSLSLLAMDVDRFKDINDAHGHQAGDRVLQQFVKVVSDRLRPADVIGRVGGEEFLVLLPETSLVEARTAAERMREAVASSSVRVNGASIGITVSIGVAEFGPDAETLDSWLSSADKRLYLAKRWGRDQVVSREGPAFN
ncbi:diguanylate cyclase [Ectothiorhodospiraceae bacterium WFHF3C12]|nr:diguanylate cyclase [Ectothiorhodospiraceae bacterium WFHF3C12]